MRKSKKQNYYETLDVPITASVEDIEKAYRLTKKALSDNSLAVYSLFDEKETKSMLNQIEEAFATLSSLDARRKYDKEVLGLNHEQIKEQRKKKRSTVSRDYLDIDEESTSEKDTSGIDDLDKDILFKTEKDSEEEKVDIDPSFEEEIVSAHTFPPEFLKKVREYRGISISKIASVTKINPDYIQAIEDFNLLRLPPRVYLAGFLRQYAKFLNLEAQKVVDYYLKQVEESKKG